MKKLLLLMLMAILMLPMAMKAQTTDITVGNGTGAGYYAPFGNYYEDSWDESIYPASAINAAGTITAVAYNCAAASSLTFNTLKIYMGTKTSSSHSDDNDWLPMSDLTLVYQGSNVTVGSTTGWQTFQLDVPYFYDGQNDLVIVVAKDQSGYSSSQTWYNTTSTGATLHYQADADITYSQHPGADDGDMYDYYPNVKLTMSVTPITCPAPTGFAVSTISDNSADLTWNAGGTESSWDIYVASSATDIPDETSTPTYTTSVNSYSMQGLTSSTNYKVYVRANCGAGDVSVWRSTSFLTPQVPAQMPYICDFEDASENSNWTLICNNTNKWVIDTAVNATDNGQSALYISNDNGTTNNYSHETSTAWAYRDIEFDNSYAEYHVSFDFKGVGESASYDNLRVYIGAPANPPAAGSSSGACPQGAVEIGNFHNETSWIHPEIVLNSSFTGVQRLYFLWWNDSGGGNPPAAAVDNLEVTGVNCGTPYNLALDTTTQTSVAFTFHPVSPNDNSWQVILVNNGDTIDESQAITISDTAYEFTNLTPNTAYQIYVRTDCGSETSWWSSALNVRTDCPDYITIPFTENFDTYGAGSSSYYPSCWTRLTNYSTQYPYISSTTPSSAPGNLYFYSTTAYYSCAVAPQVDTNTNMITSLTASFKVKKTSTTSGYGALEIGIMTDPTNISTFTPIQSFTGSEWTATSTWYEVEVPFTNYTGYGSYIALRKPATVTGYTYVDDFSVYPTPTCVKPMNVALSQITDNSVSVAWTARNGESEWQVAVVPHGTPIASVTPENAYTNPYTVYNLTDNTTYDVYVKAVCGGGDESPWTSAVSFTTRCLPTSVIPYTENFDTYGSGGATYYPNCWNRMTNNTTNYPYISSTHYSGVGSLYFYCTSAYYSLATSQVLDLSAYSAGELMMSFKAKKSSSNYGRLDVGVMTDASNLNSMTVLLSIYPTDYDNTTDWKTFDVILPDAYTNGNVYLAFLAPVGASSYAYVDDVTLDYAPTCMNPSNLQVGQVTGTVAELSWTEPEIAPDSYTIEYSEAGQNNWTVADSYVQGTSYFVTGLNAETAYDVRITSNCNDGTPTPVVANFTTGCLAGGDIQVGNGTASSYFIPVSNYYNYTYTQQIFLASELGGANTFNSISFDYAYSSSSTSKTNCVIYLGHTTQSSFSSSSNYIPVTNLTQVYSGNLNCHQGWNTFNFTTPFQYDGTSNLVLVVDDNSGSYNGNSYTFNTHTASGTRSLYFYSDSYNPNPSNPTSAGASSSTSSSRNNVKFGGVCDNTVTCIPPVAQITDVDDESITISWVPGYTESSWELEYKAANAATWTSEGIVTTPPYIISNLNANTNYSIRMRSDCGGGDYSTWVMENVQTECSTITTLPYTENFETATGSGANYFVNCWRRGTNYSTTYPYTSSTYKHGGNYSLYFYGSTTSYSYAATPRFDDAIDMTNLQISFYGYKASASYYIEVGIMTDPTDYTTFQLIGSFTPSTISTWELAEINTNHYTGNGHYVAFRQPAYMSNNMYIDDIDIHEIPFCGRVTNITASQITTSSATISWTPGGNETDWEVLYAPAGTVDLDNDVPTTETTTSLLIDNLSANTQYDVYIRIDCGNGEYGAWTQATFRTACGIIDALPFVENFDTYGTGTTVYPSCWSKINTYSSDRPYVNSTHYEGVGSLYFYAGSSGTYNIAVMPAIDPSIPINTLKAKFMYRTTNSSDQLIVGVMTNPMDASTFVPVSTITASSTSTWYQKEVSFANYTGTGQYIAFKNAYTSTYGYAYIDNLIVDVLPSCATPTNLTFTNLTSTSVDVEWTDVPTEYSWELNYCLAGQTPSASNVVALSTTNYSLTNLTPATEYDVYVRTECSSGDGYSEYLMGSFTTQCEPISTLPYTMNFDNVTGATTTSVSVNNLPICWDNYNVGTSTSYSGYPIVYNSSSSAASGTNAMRFYTSTSSTYADQVAILPPIDVNTYDISSLQLTFDARAISTSYTFTLVAGVMESPYDFTTFVPTDTLIINSTNYDTYNMYFPNYTGTGNLIALMAPQFTGQSNNQGYVDNIILDVAPACSPVTNLEVSNIAGSSALITWEDGALGTTSDYVLEYSEHGMDIWSTISGITTTSYILSGLDPQTHYDVRVMANCGSDASTWQTIDFTTSCLAGGDIIIGNGANSTYTIPVNTFYNHSYVQELYLASEIGTAGDISSISFHYIYSTAQTKSPVTIYLGTTSQTSISTWMPISSMQQVFTGSINFTNAGDGWVNIPFTTPFNYDGTQNLVVAILNNNGSYSTSNNNTFSCHSASGMCINYQVDGSTPIDPSDSSSYSASTNANRSDIKFGFPCDNTVTCIAPNIMVSNVGQTTADLTWVPGYGESMWNLEYKADGDANWTSVPGITGSAYNFTGLNTNTVYYVRMQSDCGGGDTSNWTGTSFRTDCGAVSIPYTENFDTYGTGESAYPTCWGKINTYSSNRPYINTTNFSAPGCLYFYTGAGAYNIAVAPEIDPNEALNSLQVSFKYRVYSVNDRLVVGVMTDPNDANTFVGIDTLSLPAASTWYDRTVYLAAYQGTGRYVAFKNMCLGTATTAYAYVDDLVIDLAPSCLPPHGLTATNVTTNSVDLAWTEIGNATSWVVEYGPTGFSVGTGTTENVYSSTFTTITGLTASTAYDFYVKSDCGGDESAYSNVLTVFTNCDVVAIPYTENFDTYGTGETAYPNCWSKINTYSSNRPYISSSYAVSGTGSLYFYAGSASTYNIAITPEIDATYPVNNLQATFKYRTTYSTDKLIVGVMTNPTDATTFVPVDTITAPSTSTWVERTVLFNNYTGTGSYIAFKNEYGTTYSYGYVDNLYIETIPTCPRPQGLNVTAATTSSVTLSWTESGSATAWNIEYGPAGFTQGQGTVVPATTNPFTLTGLNASTNYSFYVQANCGGGDVSPWSNVLNAGTECNAVSLPYTENFDSYAGTTYSTAGPTPLCWTTWTDNTSYPAPHVTSSGTGCYPSSGTNALTFVASSSADGVSTGASSIAILPTFTENLNTLKISFAYRMESASYGELRVGYVTNPSSPLSTFTQVATLTGTTTVTADSIDFSTITGVPANGNIAFYWYKEYTWYTSCIDDINVTSTNAPGPGTTCDVPTNLAVSNITTTGATATWTAGGTENAWNLQYKAASAANWSNSINVTTPSYNFTGLTPNTQYQVRVQAVCDATTTSAWTAAVAFTTAEESGDPCVAPSNLTVSNIHNHDVTLSWTENGTATSWTIYYRVHGTTSWTTQTVTTNPYVLEGLQGLTEYDFQLVSNCSATETSEPSNTVTERTTNVGIEDYDAAAISVFPNPTTGMVQVSSSKYQVSSVDVYDVYGKLLKTDAMIDNNTVDMSGYAAGVYFLRISTENGVVTKRVVKK